MNWLKWMFLTVVLTTTTAMAVKTNYWTDSQSTQFKAGKTKDVVISNFGQITLGPKTTELLASRTDASLIFDIKTLTDGSILAATGSEGKILVYRNGQWDVFYQADQPYVFSLEVDKSGKIYAGTGGSTGKVLELSPSGKDAKVIFSNDKAQYIWKLGVLSDGRVIAATGPNGKLFLIDKTGSKEIFSCKQKNLQAMAIGKNDAIYVGTDKDAIIYKIEEKDGKFVSRAICDAKEKEISVLAMDDQGNLYAATASGIQAKNQAKSYLNKPSGKPVTTSQATTSSTTSAPATTQKAGVKADAKVGKKSKDIKPAGGPPIPLVPPGMGPMGADASGDESDGPDEASDENVVYRIDAAGFVTKIFKDKVDINSMVIDRENLYLGTGPQGWLFKVTPSSEEVVLLMKTETKNINAIDFIADGSMILGTASPAKVIKVEKKPADKGTFTSKVFDAKQICRWGMIDATPANVGSAGCSGTIETRSSVIANPEDPGWSEWSKPVDIKSASHISSPVGRYFQYRITFENKKETPAIVNKVQIAYMQDNRAPEVTAVTVNTGTAAGAPQASEDAEDGEEASDGPPMPPTPSQMPGKKVNKQFRFSWKANDPNGDQMRYSVLIRRVESPYWTRLQKNFTAVMMPWDSMSAPDGKYELKVIASDKLDNPVGLGLTGARVSDEFTVDNTPPAIKDFKCTISPEGKLIISASLVDALSDISGAWVTINAGKDWQYLPAADDLYDSKSERIETQLPIKSKNKPTMITIKADDRAGNAGFNWQLIENK
jgi:WD40 repeat protein